MLVPSPVIDVALPGLKVCCVENPLIVAVTEDSVTIGAHVVPVHQVNLPVGTSINIGLPVFVHPQTVALNGGTPNVVIAPGGVEVPSQS